MEIFFIGVIIFIIGVYVFRWPLFNAAIRAQRRLARVSEKSLNLDGHDIAYLDGGSGEPLVLLHGFGANKDNWSQIAPQLSPHFRLLIPDLPGFGDSARHFEAQYGAEDQLRRLKLFIETLKLSRIHIGGNSMGGYLAGLFTARYPDTVSSLWLLAPAGVAGAQKSEFFAMLEQGKNPLLINSRADFRKLLALCFTKTPYIPAVFKRCLCERNMAERDFNEKIFTEIFTDPQSLEEVLNQLDTKTQILWGDDDKILHSSGANILAQRLRNVDTTIMKRMGHCPMLERPRETATLYLRFQGIA